MLSRVGAYHSLPGGVLNVGRLSRIAGSGRVRAATTVTDPKILQRVIDQLLRTKLQRSRVSYLALPQVSEASNLLDNPRLASLVTAIDPRLIVPFYNDIDRNNKRLSFFKTGNPADPSSSFYVRAFMNRLYGKESSAPFEGWETLARQFVDGFARIGVSELRDFYTHVLPAVDGRLNPHKDKLQDDTWKIDIRFSSSPTELLVLDEADRRWYALRFAAGGSGFVINSTLFTCFHAVRAGSTNQQSILAVYNKQGSTLQMVRDALDRMATASPPLNLKSTTEFEVPLALTHHPKPAESMRVHHQVLKHRAHCLNSLRKAVRAIDPSVGPKAVLGQVRRSIIDRAIATLPADLRSEAQDMYEKHCKLPQLANYGDRTHTEATKSGMIEAGRKNRRVVDDRWIAIQGTASVSGDTFQFREYDDTDDTRLRFAWGREGDRYRVTVSTESGNPLSKTLALLAKRLGFHTWLSNQYSVDLSVDGDTISGNTAERLREHGLTLRVVHVPGELDHKSKRALELARQEAGAKPARQAMPKRPSPAWNYFVKDQYKLAIGTQSERLRALSHAFRALDPHQKQAFEDQAAADHRRYLAEVSARRFGRLNHMDLSARPSRSRTAWNYFCEDQFQLAKAAFDRLYLHEKQTLEDTARADMRRYLLETAQWRPDLPKPKRPTSTWDVFREDNFKLTKSAFDNLNPQQKQVYRDKAIADLERYRKEMSAWRSTTPRSRTAFEIFSQESSSAGLPLGISNGDLKSDWRNLEPSVWTEFEQRAQQESEALAGRVSEWRVANGIEPLLPSRPVASG